MYVSIQVANSSGRFLVCCCCMVQTSAECEFVIFFESLGIVFARKQTKKQTDTNGLGIIYIM